MTSILSSIGLSSLRVLAGLRVLPAVEACAGLRPAEHFATFMVCASIMQ